MVFEFLKKLKEKPEELKMEEVEEKIKAIEAVENDIRDLVNWIELKNKEELVPGEGKKIEDDTANELVTRLKIIATKIGIASL